MTAASGGPPQAHESAWVAPNATLVADVILGRDVSVWFGVVIRGDGDTITVGDQTNIQDGCVLHTDPGYPMTIGSRVSVGHRVVLHGCVVEDDVLVGMGAIVMNGARLGRGSIVAAGAVVLEGTHVPPGSLVVGAPGRVRRTVREDEIEHIRRNAATYLGLAARQRAATAQG